MKISRKLTALILALIMMLSLTACGGDSSSGSGEGSTGELSENEVLIVGVSALPNGIDPEYHNSLDAMSLAANVYETLLDWNVIENENGSSRNNLSEPFNMKII